MRTADDARPGGEGQQGACDHGQGEEFECFHIIVFGLLRAFVCVVVSVLHAA